jgi:DUF4097 and DUF4098 domain-containing protein YvlB
MRMKNLLSILFLLGAAAASAQGSYETMERVGLARIEQTAVHEVEANSSLTIQTMDADIHIRKSLVTDTVTAALTGFSSTPITLNIEQVGNNLDIFTDHKRLQGATTKEMKLEVYLPQTFTGEIHLASSAGSIEAPQLVVSGLRIQTASGNITAGEIASSQIMLSSVSGKIELTGSRADLIEVETASGSLFLSRLTASELRAGSASGKVEASGVLDTVTIKTVSGSISIEVTEGSSHIETSSLSGSHTITIPKSEVTSGELKTLSGRIRHDGVEAAVQRTVHGLQWSSDRATTSIYAESVSGQIAVSN